MLKGPISSLINLEAATALGFTIPRAFWLRADQVIDQDAMEPAVFGSVGGLN
jgi:hypothetical protein